MATTQWTRLKMIKRLLPLLLLLPLQALAVHPTVRSSNISTEAANTLTHGVDLPATVGVGDLLVCAFSVDDAAPVVTWDDATVGAWTNEVAVSGGLGVTFGVWVIVAEGDEDGLSLSITTDTSQESAHICLSIQDWGGALTDVESVAVAQNTSTSADPSSITASWGSADNLFIGIMGRDAGDNGVTDWPCTSTTNDLQADSVGTGGALTGLCTDPVAGATLDLGAFTHGSDGWHATALVVEPAAAAVTFSVSPTVTATTATSYTLGYTVTGATTVYFVACNPGETVPDATEVAAGDCGSGADAEAAANEAVSGADTTAITGIKMPFHDIYAIPTSGGTVVTLADEDRAEDTDQEIVTLASVAATSVFALSSDTTGDTTADSFTITGMTDTSDFAKGMIVDVSAGFADLTDLIIVADPTATTITLETASNATTSNITVTSNVYFNPTVAAADYVEADSYATPLVSDGTHTGSNNAATLTDSAAAYTTNALINSKVSNDTDGSSCVITANTATTVTCTLTGGTQNDWDTAEIYTIWPVITWETDGDFSYTDVSGGALTSIDYCIQDVSDATGQYTVPACWTTDDKIYLFNTAPNFDDMNAGEDILIFDEDVALSGVTMTNYCADTDSHTLSFAFTGTPPTGVTYNSNGTITGTSSSEDETGAALSVLCQDPGLLSARQAFTIYTLNTYTAPDCTDGNTVAECLIEWDTAAPWYGVNLSISTSGECSSTVSTNDIISQSPEASSEVDDPLEDISVVISLGGCTNKNSTEMRLKGLRIGL